MAGVSGARMSPIVKTRTLARGPGRRNQTAVVSLYLREALHFRTSRYLSVCSVRNADTMYIQLGHPSSLEASRVRLARVRDFDNLQRTRRRLSSPVTHRHPPVN